MGIPEQYTSILGEALQKRFASIDISFVEIKGNKSDKSFDWKYKGVDCRGEFYSEEGKLYFCMDLDFPEVSGLVNKLKEDGISRKKIEETSKFLTKPKIEVHIKDRKTHYSANCRLKQNIVNLNPQKNPDLTKELIKDIWGYIMKTPIGIATGIIR
jgi:hypothetical protein